MADKKFSLWNYALSFVNVKRWSSSDTVREDTNTLKDMVVDTFKQEESSGKTSFEAAMRQYNLSDADIEKKKMDNLTISVFVLALAIGMFAYAIYMVMVLQSIPGLMASLGICSVLLTISFRFHFWYYQFSKRKLGCTFQEWKRDLFKRG